MSFVRFMLASVVATSLVGCVVGEEDEAQLASEIRIDDALKPLRANYARYNDLNNAIADGFELGVIINGNLLVNGCVKNPNPAVGAMGYHYFNRALLADPAINEDEPEALVYHTGGDGQMKLGAVEWVVKKENWETVAGNVGVIPSVFGESFVILNPMLNWYVQHAWVFAENPSGVFADWNPDVTCP